MACGHRNNTNKLFYPCDILSVGGSSSNGFIGLDISSQTWIIWCAAVFSLLCMKKMLSRLYKNTINHLNTPFGFRWYKNFLFKGSCSRQPLTTRRELSMVSLYGYPRSPFSCVGIAYASLSQLESMKMSGAANEPSSALRQLFWVVASETSSRARSP